MSLAAPQAAFPTAAVSILCPVGAAVGLYQGLQLLLQIANEPFHFCLVGTANAAAQIEIFLKIGNRGCDARWVTLGAMRVAPFVVGVGIVGLEADGFGVVLDGTIVVALVAPRNAPVVVDLGRIGLEADGLTVTPDFLIKIGGLEAHLEPLLHCKLLLADSMSRTGPTLLGFGTLPTRP